MIPRPVRIAVAAAGVLLLAACTSGHKSVRAGGADGAFKPAKGSPSQLIAQINVGGAPCGVVSTTNGLFVTDFANGMLLRLDPDSGKVQNRYRIDPKPCEIMESRTALWVVTADGYLDRVNEVSGKLEHHFKVGEGSADSVDAFGAIWVTNTLSHTLTRFDPASETMTTVNLPEIAPGGIVAAKDALWIGNDSPRATYVIKYDPVHHSVKRVPSGERPGFLTISNGAIWVSNRDGGTVTEINPTTLATIATISAGISPSHLDGFEAGTPEVWVPDSKGNLLTRIDATTGKAIERIPVGKAPAVVSVTSTVVWVTNYGDGTVWGFLPGSTF